MKRIFGIDLGTTYSCIAYVDEMGKPVIASNFEGDLTTPSAVHFESPENIVVGKEAKNAAKLFPDRVVEFVKRHMGDPTFSYEVDGVAYKPEAVSSFILRKLVSDAAQALGEEIEDVVITCPAYFGNNEREATKNAGELAGLNVHLILNEPTAAAVCYGVDSQTDDQVVLVYDLGGGTFDVTVIAIEQGNIRVVVTGGDHSLGGKDWDDRLTKYLGECFQNEHPSEDSPLGDNYSFQELAKAAEEAKKALSSREKYPLMVSHNGKRTRVELTRETLDEITNDLLDRTITLTKCWKTPKRRVSTGSIKSCWLAVRARRLPSRAAWKKSSVNSPGFSSPTWRWRRARRWWASKSWRAKYTGRNTPKKPGGTNKGTK
jgi:molecular chaperone DnaK (HSP70)